MLTKRAKRTSHACRSRHAPRHAVKPLLVARGRVSELVDRATRPVRLMGEDLVLYKDRPGTLRLAGPALRAPQCRAEIRHPEEEGLRCPYHGWLYDATGQCLEQPAEEPDSTFYQRVRTPAYPVEELGGLIFAYLGPGLRRSCPSGTCTPWTTWCATWAPP